MIKTGSAGGSAEERLRRVEHSINFSDVVLVVSAVGLEESTAPGGGGGDHTHVSHEVPSGSKPGTAFTLAATPVSGTEHIYVNGIELRRVASGALVGEYSISGAALTIGFTVQSADQIWAHYANASVSSHTHINHEVPSGAKPGTSFTLGATPTTGTEEVFLNGLQLRRVASGASTGEYSISGATLTIGMTVGTADQLWAHYRI